MAPSEISSNSATPRSTATGDSSRSGAPNGDKERAAQTGNNIVNRMKESAAAQLTSQKNRGTDALGSVAQAVRSTTEKLRDEKHDAIAGYAEQAASQIEQWSQRLKDKDIDELVADVHRLARRQPAAFIGSAFGIGLLAARFLKSSRTQDMYARGAETSRLQYRGGSGVDTVHDAPGAHGFGSDYSGQGLGTSGTTPSMAERTSATEPGNTTTGSGGGRKPPSRTERL